MSQVDVIDSIGEGFRTYLLKVEGSVVASARTSKAPTGGRLVSDVWTSPKHRGQGYSKRVFNAIFGMEPRPLKLRVGAYGDGKKLTNEQLKEYYNRLGFTKPEGDLLVKAANCDPDMWTSDQAELVERLMQQGVQMDKQAGRLPWQAPVPVGPMNDQPIVQLPWWRARPGEKTLGDVASDVAGAGRKVVQVARNLVPKFQEAPMARGPYTPNSNRVDVATMALPAKQSSKEAVVRRKGKKWQLWTADGSRVLGTHDSAQDAYKQEYAIQKSKERVAKTASMDKQAVTVSRLLSRFIPALRAVMIRRPPPGLSDTALGVTSRGLNNPIYIRPDVFKRISRYAGVPRPSDTGTRAEMHRLLNAIVRAHEATERKAMRLPWERNGTYMGWAGHIDRTPLIAEHNILSTLTSDGRLDGPTFARFAKGFRRMMRDSHSDAELLALEGHVPGLVFGNGPRLSRHAIEKIKNLPFKEATMLQSPQTADALSQLMEAKRESDRRNYKRKHSILRRLIEDNPDAFSVDSMSRGIAGLTHNPTGFRLHMPGTAVPAALASKMATATNSPAIELGPIDWKKEKVNPFLQHASGIIGQARIPQPPPVAPPGYTTQALHQVEQNLNWLGRKITGGEAAKFREYYGLLPQPTRTALDNSTAALSRAYWDAGKTNVPPVEFATRFNKLLPAEMRPPAVGEAYKTDVRRAAELVRGNMEKSQAVERVPQKKRRPWWLAPVGTMAAGYGVMRGTDWLVPRQAYEDIKPFADAMVGDPAMPRGQDMSLRQAVDYGDDYLNLGNVAVNARVAGNTTVPDVMHKVRERGSDIAGWIQEHPRVAKALPPAAQTMISGMSEHPITGEADLRHYREFQAGPLSAYHFSLNEYNPDWGDFNKMVAHFSAKAGIPTVTSGDAAAIRTAVRDYVNMHHRGPDSLDPVEIASLPRERQAELMEGFRKHLMIKDPEMYKREQALSAAIGAHRSTNVAKQYGQGARAGVNIRRAGLVLGGLLMAGGGYMMVRKIQQMRTRREEERKKKARPQLRLFPAAQAKVASFVDTVVDAVGTVSVPTNGLYNRGYASRALEGASGRLNPIKRLFVAPYIEHARAGYETLNPTARMHMDTAASNVARRYGEEPVPLRAFIEEVQGKLPPVFQHPAVERASGPKGTNAVAAARVVNGLLPAQNPRPPVWTAPRPQSMMVKSQAWWLQKPANSFSRALALESIPDSVKRKFDAKAEKADGVTAEELVWYAHNIAHKIDNNIENGHGHVTPPGSEKQLEKAALTSSEVAEAGKVVPRKLSLRRRASGNYRKGIVTWNGLRISIETPAGHWRIGKKEDGKLWFTKMRDAYGYIQRHEGYDGDAVDVFLGPDLDSPWVHVVNQTDGKSDTFDEVKCVIGCHTEAEARLLYMRNYTKGWRGYRNCVRMSVEQFKNWLPKAKDGPASHGQLKAAAFLAPLAISAGGLGTDLITNAYSRRAADRLARALGPMPREEKALLDLQTRLRTVPVKGLHSPAYISYRDIENRIGVPLGEREPEEARRRGMVVYDPKTTPTAYYAHELGHADVPVWARSDKFTPRALTAANVFSYFPGAAYGAWSGRPIAGAAVGALGRLIGRSPVILEEYFAMRRANQMIDALPGTPEDKQAHKAALMRAFLTYVIPPAASGAAVGGAAGLAGMLKGK